MIPAPSAAFLAEEARRQGATPVFRATIFPHYFRTGVAADSGTFVNCAFVAPDRIQVNAGAGNASWTSPALRATVGSFPVLLTPTWASNSPGYNPVVVELRTAGSEAELAAAPWTALTSGTPVAISEYYQWRGSWFIVRSWVFKNEADMDDSAIWVRQTYDPADPYQSYASKSISGDVSYVEQMRFSGEFLLPSADIKLWGTLDQDLNLDFTDFSAADHTLTMVNREQRYSPTHENFIFAGETNWFRKFIRLEFGYELPYGGFTEFVTLYVGTILKWGPVPHGVDQGGKYLEHTAEIYSRDVTAALLEEKIGVPDDDGTPQPLVMGEVLRQAEQLGDETLGDPQASAGFESGGTGELAGVDTGGDGAVEVVGTEPYDGDYCFRTAAGTAGAYAKGRLKLPAASATPLFTAMLRFVTVPGSPLDKNMHFLGLYNEAGDEQVQFYVANDFRVWAKINADWKETDWYINQDQGVWLRASIGFDSANPGVVKLWVNGNEVLTWDQDGSGNPLDWSGYSFKGAFVGPHLAAAESWEIHSDAWEFCNDYFPVVYRVPGGPYESIGTVYADGVIKIEQPVTKTTQTPVYQWSWSGKMVVVSRYISATVQAGSTMTKVPASGAVIFNDLANPPSGSIFFRLVKDSLVHPVDQVEAIITAVGRSGQVDAASFAAAKAAWPNDSLGCYFDNVTAGDALKAICSRAVLLFILSGAQIKLLAYTGVAPVDYDLSLTERDLVIVDPGIDMEGLTPKVTVKWGWYERNHALYKVYKNETAISFLQPAGLPAGQWQPPAAELDFSWGGEVGSDNAQMAMSKAQLLLTRGQAARESCTWAGFRNLMRGEPGDFANLNLSRRGPAAIFQVSGKTVRLDPPRGVDLRLVRFLGEN